MVAKNTAYVCQSCGHEALRWAGQCGGCGEWNTLVEAPRETAKPAAGGRLGRPKGAAAKPVALRDVSAPADERLLTGIDELDRVLGGGLVPGSLVLLGGSPGIGKSTITGMALGNMAAAGRRTLYISGEESAAQVRMRAQRLGEGALAVPAVTETSLENVLATLEAEQPDACVIDSIQTLHSEGMSGAPGSVGQVREAANAILEVAKRTGSAVILVGHVTKEGAVAGPRVLEHLVDCVLFFEGERERSFRTLRALKNRFGATSEVGVFEMQRRRPGRGRGPVGALRRRGIRGSRLRCPVLDGGDAPAPRRGPGPRRSHRDRPAPAGRERGGPQPHGDDPRRPCAPRRPWVWRALTSS